MPLCDVCKKEHSRKRWSRYCSTKCRSRYYYIRKNGGELSLRPVYINCLLCGKTREKKTHDRRYCESCGQKEYRKIWKPEYKEKLLKKSREWYRKKMGYPIDLPLQHAPAGSGTNHRGYRSITLHGHPNANKYGKVFEHTVIMSEYLGRPIRKGESVHHKNGIRDDNRLENLELWNKNQPPGQRVEEKIEWCKEFLEQYGYTIIMEPKANS